MSLEDYDSYVEEESLTKWLDKKALKDKSIEYRIVSVKKMDKDMVLELEETGKDEPEPQLFRVPMGIKNALVKRLGHKTAEWKGAFISLKFTEFIPKPGQQVNEGIQTNLIEEVEETLEA